MSRMSKFLKQQCCFERAQRDEADQVLLSDYGDVLYEASVQLKCRREGFAKDVQTNTGAVVKVSTRYFLDESVEIRVDDRLDGHVVLSVEEYTNQLGHCEGYECYV